MTTVFTLASEYEFMEHKSVIERVKYALRERGLLVYDAFRAFNSSNSGLLTCSELYGGMSFLEIPFVPEVKFPSLCFSLTDGFSIANL